MVRVAVIADSHVEPPGDSEPRSNARTRKAVRALRALEPAFVIHLGDLIHPIPQLSSASTAWHEVAGIMSGLQVPVYATPGNHDIGDKPNPLMPAAGVRSEWVGTFENKNGPSKNIADLGDCRFVLFSSPKLNADATEDEALLSWLDETLRNASGRRLFVATHYPIFLHSPDEPSHYDNIDEPARERLLKLFEQNNVKAVFTGHIHNFFWHRHHGTEFYGVPSLAFVRRDYAELFRVGPYAEAGRDDPQKVGFFIIDVHEHGHVVRFIRLPDYDGDDMAIPGHVKTGPAPIGVDLRHPWAETTVFPFNPPTDAFLRKRVRNDYSVQALIELGIKDVRVPIEDLETPETRSRMADLSTIGIEFTVFTTDLDGARLNAALGNPPRGLKTLELIGLREVLCGQLEAVARLTSTIGCHLALNELRPAAASGSGKHRVDIGQSPADLATAEAFLSVFPRAHRSALVFRAQADESDARTVGLVSDFSRSHDINAILHVAWAAEDMSASATDETELIALIDRLWEASAQAQRVTIFLDTFMEFDRSYHVRSGLIDRRCNFTAAGWHMRRFLAQTIR